MKIEDFHTLLSKYIAGNASPSETRLLEEYYTRLSTGTNAMRVEMTTKEEEKLRLEMLEAIFEKAGIARRAPVTKITKNRWWKYAAAAAVIASFSGCMRVKNNYTEQQLVEAFRRGDENAFSQMFRILYPAMCFYALRYTHDQAAAEDIAEESFLKIWDRRATFSNYKVLRSFLYATVRNASLNWVKIEKRSAIHKNELAILSEVSESSVLENIVRAEVFNDVYAAFGKLPPKCRQIISMIFFEGKNAREVAEELNLSIGTVKTQKARGLMLLRNRLTVLIILITQFI